MNASSPSKKIQNIGVSSKLTAPRRHSSFAAAAEGNNSGPVNVAALSEDGVDSRVDGGEEGSLNE